MYAVIKTGGKQYRVSPGQTLKVEKLPQAVGEAVVFDKVLMVAEGEDVKVGKPHLSGAEVSAEVIEQGRAKKIKIIKFKRRKHHMKCQGHRQYFTEVKITDIQAGSAAQAA